MVTQKRLKHALRAQIGYLRDNLESLTMKSVRRMLEKQLGLDARSLDEQKPLVAALVDEVLEGVDDQDLGKENVGSAPATKSASVKDGAKTKPKRKAAPKPRAAPKKPRTAPKKKTRDDDDDDDDVDDSEDVEEDDESEDDAPRKARRGRAADSASGSSEAEDSEDGAPRRKPAPGARPAASYGKRVEKLRRICKQATISIPPNVYIKNRGSESNIARALEALLEKHDLSASSSSADIQAARAAIQKQKDLDGIDTSNIIASGGRRPRRAAAAPVSYAAPDSDDDGEDAHENASDGEGEGDGEGSSGGGSDEDEERSKDGGRPAASNKASTSKQGAPRGKGEGKAKRSKDGDDGGNGDGGASDGHDHDELADLDDALEDEIPAVETGNAGQKRMAIADWDDDDD